MNRFVQFFSATATASQLESKKQVNINSREVRQADVCRAVTEKFHSSMNDFAGDEKDLDRVAAEILSGFEGCN